MYADSVTRSMREAMDETDRRRDKQLDHNLAHGVTPHTIRKNLDNALDVFYGVASGPARGGVALAAEEPAAYGLSPEEASREIKKLERQMREAAKELEFERAAGLRDRIKALREQAFGSGA